MDSSTKESSVHKTQAASNGKELVGADGKKYKPYTYNTAGNPYAAEDLDSIDVDFQAEVSFDVGSPYLTKDWDLPFGSDTPHNNYQDGSGRTKVGVGKLGNYGWHDHLRIHSTLNFEDPYPARSTARRESPNLPDILWARIESERRRLRYPDSPDPYTKLNIDIRSLNSVRQIIICFNKSNFDTAGKEYRPVIIFYDGPERYNTLTTIRDSKPIIVNFNAPIRAILYAPNSPVVILGDAKDSFRGFIVAKKYMRLKTTADFEAELQADPGKYTRDGDSFQSTKAVSNPYYGKNHTDKDGKVIKVRDNGEPETIKWLYTKIVNPANGIEMYVDDYGNVQYMPLSNAPTKCGTFDNFGRTDFTSHGYHIDDSSAKNLLLSGN